MSDIILTEDGSLLTTEDGLFLTTELGQGDAAWTPVLPNSPVWVVSP
jgi:hypothetical protein